MQILLLTLLLAANEGQQAIDSEALLNKALAREASSSPRDFLFQETRSVDGQLWVSQFDPNGEQQWTLSTVDGVPPDEEQLERAMKWRSPKETEDGEPEKSSLLGEMIDPTQAELIESNGRQAIYRFTPIAETEDDKALFQHLQGRLTIDLQNEFVERLEMSNEDAFKPMTGVRIDHFLMEMEFALHDQLIDGQKVILPREVQTDVKGRAFLVKSIDEQTNIKFEHFRVPVAATSD